ncbi:hypothetical protein DESC_870095 [Desulfosarcina cetonica]|nr:hypothetical protein DESC_870095 [Desulfosarcina cetonica]
MQPVVECGGRLVDGGVDIPHAGKHHQVVEKRRRRDFMLDTLEFVYPAHQAAIGNTVAVGQDPGAVGQIVEPLGQACEKSGQPPAAGSVHGGNAGNESIHQAIENSAEQVAQAVETTLAVAVQGDRLAMGALNGLAELAGVPGILLGGHGLQIGRVGDVLQDTDIGGDSLVGEGMGVAALFARQESENIGAQDVRRDDQNRLGVHARLDIGKGRCHPIELEAAGFVDQRMGAALEVKAVFRFDGGDGLGVVNGDPFHQARLALAELRQLFDIVVEERFLERFNAAVGLVANIGFHHPGAAVEAPRDQFEVVFQKTEVGFQVVRRGLGEKTIPLDPLEVLGGAQIGGEKIGCVA